MELYACLLTNPMTGYRGQAQRLWSDRSAEYVEALPNKKLRRCWRIFTKARSLFAEDSSTVESAYTL